MTKRVVTKKEKVSGSLALVLRKLRPLMTGTVVKDKTDPTEYEIDGKVFVKLNYYCVWSDAERKKAHKTCNPHTITVSMSPSHLSNLGMPSSSKWVGVKTRTFQLNKAGDFNYKGIAVAITKVINEVDRHVDREKIRRKSEEEKEKQKRILYNALSDIIDQDKNNKPNSRRPLGKRHTISFNTTAPEDADYKDPHTEYDLSICNISFDMAKRVIGLLGLLKKGKK